MQREENGQIVISCDFCRRDWDGVEPMVEGHHGSIICPPCLKAALRHIDSSAADPASALPPSKYTCTLCLRFNIPGTLARWSNPAHPEAVVCQDCIKQSAGVLRKAGRTTAPESGLNSESLR